MCWCRPSSNRVIAIIIYLPIACKRKKTNGCETFSKSACHRAQKLTWFDFRQYLTNRTMDTSAHKEWFCEALLVMHWILQAVNIAHIQCLCQCLCVCCVRISHCVRRKRTNGVYGKTQINIEFALTTTTITIWNRLGCLSLSACFSRFSVCSMCSVCSARWH